MDVCGSGSGLRAGSTRQSAAIAEADGEASQGTRVKLAGRRRLTSTVHEEESEVEPEEVESEEEWEETEQESSDEEDDEDYSPDLGGGGDSSMSDIQDSLSTSFDPRPIHRHRSRLLASVTCALATDDDDDDSDAEEEGKSMEISSSGGATYKLPAKISKILKPHQCDGIPWLWDLHCEGTGGILADDMGLGKTMQVSAFLAGLFHSRLIKRVLIVVPRTLIDLWIQELSAVGLKKKIRDYYSHKKNIRKSELNKAAYKKGGILLTTYGIVSHNYEEIRGDEDKELWDYVVLDEGHLIRNTDTQRSQSLFEIPCDHRIVISGTPIQNDLMELWALFDFCCQGVLSDKEEFKTTYVDPICQGNDKNATAKEKQMGSNAAQELREQIKPYFLRRLKSEVFANGNGTLPKKNELAVWLKLTAFQRELYEAFVNSFPDCSAELPKGGSHFVGMRILEQICNHPLLLIKTNAVDNLESTYTILTDEVMGMVEEKTMNLQVDQGISCKLSFIMSLLRNLVEEGHHVLIFSGSLNMLDLVQEAILLEGYDFLRMDGTTNVSERKRIVKDFQEGPGAPIFLLSSKVGGLGLTLTKADRVIVVDPDWNPSTENQSVDRAYRIGQDKDVLVYRLLTSGTIEEEKYKLQVKKGVISRSATEQKEQTPHCSLPGKYIRLPEQGFDVSLTQNELQAQHEMQVVLDESLQKHIQFLEEQGIAGVSHHSLLFSKTVILPPLTEHDAPEMADLASELDEKVTLKE